MTESALPFVTRFAPSPTGYLHPGHAYSACLAFDEAQKRGGTFILRIEDIDPVRCKPEFITAIYEDLHWLGLNWPTPVRLQSEHMEDYRKVLEDLMARDLVYPCFCSRADIQREALAAAHAPHEMPETLYPRTCRRLTPEQQKKMMAEKPFCWRLDMGLALAQIKKEDLPLRWHDKHRGWVEAHPEAFGDIVIARKDIPTSYHLSVVIDDALQGVTHIIRGCDLFRVTDIHCLLQKILNLPTPTYEHHALVRDEHGQRYAKRRAGAALRLQETGFDRADPAKMEARSDPS